MVCLSPACVLSDDGRDDDDTRAVSKNTSALVALYRHDFRPRRKLIQIISPSLHHSFALWQMLRTVIRGATVVAFGVGELALDGVPVPALIIQQGRCHRAEAMAGHFGFRVGQTAQGGVDGVLAHRSGAAANAGKHQSAVAGV